MTEFNRLNKEPLILHNQKRIGEWDDFLKKNEHPKDSCTAKDPLSFFFAYSLIACKKWVLVQ